MTVVRVNVIVNGMNDTEIIRSAPETNGYERDEALAQAEIIISAVIFVITVIGNCIVLLALYARQKYSGCRKLSRMYFFILHLCIADLVTAFFDTLPQLCWDITYRFKGGAIMCKIVKYNQPLGPYLSAYILSATAIDRHQAICYPLTYCSWTSRCSRVMIWMAWAASLTFCIPQLLIFSYQEAEPGVWDCWGTFMEPWGAKAYVTWYSMSVFILPLCVLVYTYTCICHVIWRTAGHGILRPVIVPPAASTAVAGAANTLPSSSRHPHVLRGRRSRPFVSRAKINTVKQTIAVIAMYIVCSMPFISAQLWVTWDPNATESPFFSGATFTILTLLSSLNSCVNPWIFLLFNKDLFRLLKRLFVNNLDTSKTKCSRGSGSKASTSSSAVETAVGRLSWLSKSTRSNKSSSNKSFQQVPTADPDQT